MQIEEAIGDLKYYIGEDPYFNGTYEPVTDFEKYCYNNCKAIDTVLNELEKKNKELKEAQKETMQIYSDYQDIGKIAFDLDEKVQNLIKKLEEDAEKYKKENADGTLQDYIKEILSILKGEKE